jgi:hypothetical protein
MMMEKFPFQRNSKPNRPAATLISVEEICQERNEMLQRWQHEAFINKEREKFFFLPAM